MHVRVRLFGKPETIVVVESKLTKIEKFRRILQDKLDVPPNLQRLFYGGKLLEDGYTFHDYNIKLNDVIQVTVKVQPEKGSNQSDTEAKAKNESDKRDDKESDKVEYKDAKSNLYAVGDLVDVRDRESGVWLEAKIVRIVQDPDMPLDNNNSSVKSKTDLSKKHQELAKKNGFENNSPNVLNGDHLKPKRGIDKYIIKKSAAEKQSQQPEQEKVSDVNILYKVEIEEDETIVYCKLKEIRPRAKTIIDINDLKPGQKVMVNHNPDNVLEKGYWYDFRVIEIKKQEQPCVLIGTLYLGPEGVPQDCTKLTVLDKIYEIEQVVPLEQRTDTYKKLMITQPEKRSRPLKCLTCHDDEDALCKDCGCMMCSGKEFPDKIVLCDECDQGFHMACLDPPLAELPEEDWYCPSCKRDSTHIIAPGASKQTKKSAKSTRDWGRGMACAGKTKTCAMPPNHFGPIPGIEVGMCWRFRIQLSESGVHRPPVSGIHGRDVEGAYSIVLSGGYEDDVDNGNEFTYTGSGGRDLSGNKRTAEQSCDQTLTRENRALARNCAVKEIREEGGDAGDNWRSGRPVRVVRSYKMIKHFPKYAPTEGIRYDGIYKVVKYYPEKGLSGYRVWKYLLRRDDPAPAPWEPNAKRFAIVYPDGYLEAEAEKKALAHAKAAGKGNKRALQERNQSSDPDMEFSLPAKKRKGNNDEPQKKPPKNKQSSSLGPLKNSKAPKSSVTKPGVNQQGESALTSEERDAIMADTVNAKLWGECLEICEGRGKMEFVEHVTQVFLCIICQSVTVAPITTPCFHNFCMACLKLAFKSTESQVCPCCRHSLANYQPQTNQPLMKALQSILPGYDAGKK